MPYRDFTEQEKLVEKCLNELDLRFEMQTQIGHYTVDFFVEKAIVIEADGALRHLKKADRKRDEDLIALGVEEIYHIKEKSYKTIMERLKDILCLG